MKVRSLAAHPHLIQVDTSPYTSPQKISSLLPCRFLPRSWMQVFPCPLLSHPHPITSLCPLPVSACTIQAPFPCHQLPPCLHFCSPKFQVSSLSPPLFVFPHMNICFEFFGTPITKSHFFTMHYFVVYYKHRIRKLYSSKHTILGAFQTNPNLLSLIHI